jgi:hypothetical protein
LGERGGGSPGSRRLGWSRTGGGEEGGGGNKRLQTVIN